MARKTKEEAQITRERILKAALSVFSRMGYASSTLEDVATEANVTRGAIYWHFNNKVDLYDQLLESYAGRSQEIIQAAIATGGNFEAILRRIFVNVLTAVEDDPVLKEVMEISLFKSEKTTDLLQIQQKMLDSTQILIQGIAAAFEQAVVNGEIHSGQKAIDVARSFLAFQNGILYLWLSDPYKFSLHQNAKTFAEIFLHGVIN